MGIDHSARIAPMVSRRSQLLDVTLRRVPTGEGLHLVVDGMRLSIVGEGEWATAKHAYTVRAAGRSSIWLSTDLRNSIRGSLHQSPQSHDGRGRNDVPRARGGAEGLTADFSRVDFDLDGAPTERVRRDE